MMYIARISLGAFVFTLFSLCIPFVSSADQVTVEIESNNTFSPKNITIDVGDTVVWDNEDNEPHTATADNGAFDSGTMQPGSSYARTFTVPGTYSYHCAFHPGMVGTITVVGPSVPVGGTQVPSSVAGDLQAQAQALYARVQQLQAQLQAQQGGVVVPTTAAGGVALDSSSCPLIGRSLTIGATGDDVTRLQQFLARDPGIYPEALVSGYYGSLTEAAVKRWQTKYHVVSSGDAASTGFGVVGPRTAAAISILCTTGSYAGVPGPGGATAPVGGYIQVTPVSGNAPLAVAVQAVVNTVNSCAGATYTLDYGDGSQPALITVPAGNCSQMTQTLGHTYTSGGTHRLTLSAAGHQTSATVQVFGGSSNTPNPTPSTSWGIVSVTPAVGGNLLAVSIVVEYPSCDPYSVDWDDGSLPTTGTVASNCDNSTTKRVTINHTYANDGSYTIELRDNTGTERASSAISISQ